jgi:hypothetical protein
MSSFSVGRSGVPRSAANVLFAVVASCLWLGMPLRAQFVYVANGGGSNDVSAYRVDENGALIPVPGSPFAAGAQPSSVTASP